jgi:hypothetical protein
MTSPDLDPDTEQLWMRNMVKKVGNFFLTRVEIRPVEACQSMHNKHQEKKAQQISSDPCAVDSCSGSYF